MSDIRFNQWLHQSGTGGVSQVASGAVGVGTTNPLADFYVRGDAQITGILTAGHIAMGSSITFGDNDRIYLGDGTDFQLYHASSDNNSYIVESGAGSLVVNASKFHVKNAANNEDIAVFNQSGNNELYFSNSKKFETTNTGAVVTGILTATSFSGGLPITNGADNRVITASSASAIQGESGLTYDGSSLDVSGIVKAVSDGNAGVVLHRTFSGNVSGATNTPQLDFTLTDTATSNQVVAKISPQALAGTGNAFKGNLRFFTANDAGTSTERLRINSAGDILLGTDQATIGCNTADGSDNRSFSLCGGSDASQSRGGIITIYGNEGNDGSSRYGCLYLRSGNTSTGIVSLWTQGNERIRIDADGIIETGSAVNGSGFDTNQRFRIGRAGDCNLAIRNTANTTSHTGIDFGDTGDDRSGRIQYMHNGDYMSFHTNGAGSGTSNERLRITSGGQVQLNTDGSQTASNISVGAGADLKIYHDGSDSYIRNITNTDLRIQNIGNAGIEIHNQNSYPITFNTNGIERLRIHNSGAYFYGNDNYFYGGISGTNLNGDIKIRSTGSAVYQSLKFMSSDGSSQSQILGYGGGAILFHYSNTFVWAINNQGERLELTNTGLSPRANSTVLDLGTTAKRFRRTYTDGITVNTSNTNTKFCINGGSSTNVMTIRNTTGGNGSVGILFSTQDHSGGREKAAIYHQETHGQAHYGGDFVFCLNTATGGATQVSLSDRKARLTRHGDWMVGTDNNGNGSNANEPVGTVMKSDGQIICRRNDLMFTAKSIATGGYTAFRTMSAQTEVGNITFNSGGTSYNTSSDYRRKENIVSITDGITKVKQLKVYRFNFKDNPSETVDGFLAHEAQEVIPHVVKGTKDQVATAEDVAAEKAISVGDPIYQVMDQSKLVPLLTAALQEALAKIETLEAKVAALESS